MAEIGKPRSSDRGAVTVEHRSDSPLVRLTGHGYEVTYSPTHNTAWWPSGHAGTMTPEQVAAEFRWRWKRDGCPA
jgi:hypothetical protein